MRDWSMRAAIDGSRDRIRQYDERFSGEEVAAIDAARARADSVLNLWGDRASQPLAQESSREYRRRVLKAVQDKSPKFKGKTYSTLGDALAIVEEHDICRRRPGGGRSQHCTCRTDARNSRA